MTTVPKVSLIRCPSYSNELIETLQALLMPFGGMAAFVNPGQSVLIKPNMLTDRTPEQGVTTHPEIIRTVIRMVRTCGGTPLVGDSPASAVKLERVHNKTGIATMCSEEDVPLISFESSGSVSVQSGDALFQIAKPVIEADVIINIPKVKTHVLTTLTAAVKNLYGVLPGYQKANLHKSNPDSRSFARLLNALNVCVQPALHIADGIIGMEGDGPSGGTPVQLGFLAASTNAYALDQTLCRILGIPESSVPYLSSENGAPPRIAAQLIGERPEAIAPAHFRVPGTLAARLLPAKLIKMLDRFLWIRPTITSRCVQCGRCVEACPVSALDMQTHNNPSLSPDRCIGCCCCHEVCPAKAIEMTLSPLLGFLRHGRTLS